MAFDTWESYFYPPPDDATMCNVQGIRYRQALQVFEHGATALRQRQLFTDPTIVAHTYDSAHMRAIHRHLFQDVYEWAGEFRIVNMSKQWPPELGRGYTDPGSDRPVPDAMVPVFMAAAVERTGS